MNDTEKNHSAYWRSPEEIAAASGKEHEGVFNEFMHDLSQLTEVKRRDMLKLMGASLAVAGVGISCRRPEEKILPYSKMPEGVTPGIARYFATTLPSPEGDAVGVLVESHEGRPTKIEGNPDHPSSKGKTGFREQAAILQLYDPDRSRFVTKKSKSISLPATFSEWDSFAENHFSALANKKGAGLAIITDGNEGPTFTRLLAEVTKRFPQALVAVHNPLRCETTRQACELAFGPGIKCYPELSAAKVIVSLSADPLMNEVNHLRNARGFAQSRRLNSASDAKDMNRLYAFEAVFTVTGANADHRVRMPMGEQGDFLKALAYELAMTHKVSVPVQVSKVDINAEHAKVLSVLAKDLVTHQGSSLLLVGEHLPVETHVLAHAINTALGGLGKTFKLLQAPAAATTVSLEALAQSIKGGNIDTLISLDVNPIYSSPAALELKDAFKKVANTIHMGLYEDETANCSQWHLPMAHTLESFSDARAFDGTCSIIQPLIAPLFGGRSTIEFLAQLAGVKDRKGLSLIESTWREGTGSLKDEKNWRKVIHDGLIGQTAFKEIFPSFSAKALTSPNSATRKASKDSLELILNNDYRVGDGRYANLAWLQELPDPINKLTWGNALLLSPKLATALNINSRVTERVYSSDIVELSVDGKKVEVPTFIMPGLADYSVSLSLGYGREDAGVVGNKVGINAYPLLPASGARILAGVSLKKTGKVARLASTQEQFAMNGDAIKEGLTLSLMNRDPARANNAADYQNDPAYVKKKGLPKNLMHEENGELKPLQLTKAWDYSENNKWGMVVDLTACIGCNACTIACQAENNIPVVGPEQVMRGRVMHWIRIDRYFTGNVENPRAIHQPIACMHCENAPCEPVCPVAATSHDSEGLNVMTYNRCLGTRYCSNNCPYKVRRFNFHDFSHSGNLYVDELNLQRRKLLSMQANPNVTIRYRGVMEKCTYCTQRIQKAKQLARNENRDPYNLVDGDVVPACAQACPTDAITFGNLNDKNSRVVQLKKVDRNYDLLEEINTRPRTSYLSHLRNPNPELV